MIQRISYCTSLLFILMISIDCQQRKDQKSTDLRTILDNLQANIAVEPSYVRVECFKDFDFLNFEPKEKTMPKGNHFKVYYDKGGKVVKISSHSELPYNSFEYILTYEDLNTYKIFLILQLPDGTENLEETMIEGFILQTPKQCYFFGERKFKSAAFMDSLNQIGCIMLLDRHLKPKENLYLEEGKVKKISKVNYLDSARIDSESIFANDKELSISDNTTINDIEKIFTSLNLKFQKKIQIGVVDEYRYVPLWVDGGNHYQYK
jgi:hypothetical protein